MRDGYQLARTSSLTLEAHSILSATGAWLIPQKLTLYELHIWYHRSGKAQY